MKNTFWCCASKSFEQHCFKIITPTLLYKIYLCHPPCHPCCSYIMAKLLKMKKKHTHKDCPCHSPCHFHCSCIVKIQNKNKNFPFFPLRCPCCPPKHHHSPNIHSLPNYKISKKNIINILCRTHLPCFLVLQLSTPNSPIIVLGGHIHPNTPIIHFVIPIVHELSNYWANKTRIVHLTSCNILGIPIIHLVVLVIHLVTKKSFCLPCPPMHPHHFPCHPLLL